MLIPSLSLFIDDCECDDHLNNEECGYDGGDCTFAGYFKCKHRTIPKDIKSRHRKNKDTFYGGVEMAGRRSLTGNLLH